MLILDGKSLEGAVKEFADKIGPCLLSARKDGKARLNDPYFQSGHGF
jgi:hypothetical protein